MLKNSPVDLCNALNELSEEEKIAELLPISVQQVYVLSKLRKFEEAERVASEVSIEESERISFYRDFSF